MIPTRVPVPGDPFADESLHGFVLRMAGRNRMAGLKWILDQLGRRSIAQLGEADERRIAYLFGADARAVEGLIVPGRWIDGVHVHWVRGQEVTRPYLLRIARPQWCSRCLAEFGYARVAWSMQLVTACNVHRVRLLERCPSCSRPLRWQRRSLLACTCGASLQDAACAPASDEELAVARWIAGHLESASANDPHASPWMALLEGLSLDGGMRLLYSAGLQRDAGHRVGPGEARAGLTTLECRLACQRAAERLGRLMSNPSDEDRVHLRQLIHIPALLALSLDGTTAIDRQLARSTLEVGLRVAPVQGRFASRSQNAQLALPGV
jgi:hypothetical protein